MQWTIDVPLEVSPFPATPSTFTPPLLHMCSCRGQRRQRPGMDLRLGLESPHNPGVGLRLGVESPHHPGMDPRLGVDSPHRLVQGPVLNFEVLQPDGQVREAGGSWGSMHGARERSGMESEV